MADNQGDAAVHRSIDKGGIFVPVVAIDVGGAGAESLWTGAGGGGSGVQYVEDAAAAADPTGTAVVLVRKDTPAATVSTDGDNIAQRGTNFGAAYVTLLDTGGNPVAVGGGTQYTEDAVSAADPIGTAVILVRKDTPAATVTTDGDNIAQRGSNFGAAYVTLLDTSGNPVAVGGGTQYTEDAVAAADPVGTALIMVRKDTLASEVSADGDNIAARSTSKGEQYVKHVDPIPVTDNAGSLTVDGTVAVSNATFPVTDNAGSLTVDAPVGTPVFVRLSDGSAAIATLPVAGNVAAAGADSGNPVKIGAKVNTTRPTYTDGQRADAQADTRGNLSVHLMDKDTANPVSIGALAGDTIASPNVSPFVGAFGLVYNGTTWDRHRGDITNGLDVDVTRLPALVAGAADIGGVNLTKIAGTAPDVNSGNKSAGTLRVILATDQPALTTAMPVSLATAPTTPVTNADITTIAGAIKAEDVASADAHPGMVILARRTATPANTSGTDLDYEVPQMNAGRLWVDPSGVTLTVASHAVTNAGTFAVQAAGSVAEDAALSGNPLIVGGRAHSGVPTAMSADNDLIIPWMDRSGALAVMPQVRQVRVTATPTIATSGYVDNDQIGGLQTYTNAALASGRPGLIVGATITSRTVTALNALELWIFEASPTLAGSDNAAFDLSDANLEAARPTAVIDFLAADYRNTVSGVWCLGSVKGGKVSEPFVTSGSANLFGVLVATAAPAAQYGGTTDIVVALEIQQF